VKKRQRKKNKKKCIPIIADEFCLLTMTDEERQKALEEYRKFRQKFAFRKKYKDLKKSKPLIYYYPLGSLFTRRMMSIARKPALSTLVTQTISDVQKTNGCSCHGWECT